LVRFSARAAKRLAHRLLPLLLLDSVKEMNMPASATNSANPVLALEI